MFFSRHFIVLVLIFRSMINLSLIFVFSMKHRMYLCLVRKLIFNFSPLNFWLVCQSIACLNIDHNLRLPVILSLPTVTKVTIVLDNALDIGIFHSVQNQVHELSKDDSLHGLLTLGGCVGSSPWLKCHKFPFFLPKIQQGFF